MSEELSPQVKDALLVVEMAKNYLGTMKAVKNLTDDVVRGALSAEQLSIKLELIIKGVHALVDEAEHSQKQVEAL